MTSETRGPGNPPPRERQITEAEYPEMYRAFLRGAGASQIAKRFGTSRQNVSHHLSRCRAQMRQNMLRDRNEVLTELAAVRYAAWESFDKSQTPVKIDEVRAELEKAAEGNVASERVAAVSRQVTRMVSKHGGDPTWLHVIIAAIYEECRLTGIYEVSKMEAALRRPQIEELRVAGSSPEEIEKVVAHRLANVLDKMRESIHGDN